MSDFKDANILVLNVHKKDSAIMNDFADFNAWMLIKNASSGQIYCFGDSVVNLGIKRTEENIRRIIRDKNVSVVFFAPNGDSYELTIEFFKSLKDEFNVSNVLWVLDDEFIFDIHTKYYAQVFDAAVTCDYYATFGYKKLGIPALYYFSSYLKEDFHPADVDKDIDVSFVGDCTKADRAQYIRFLKDNGIDIRTYGDGSENGFLEKDEMSAIFSRSKINLNFTKCNRPQDASWFIDDNSLVNLIRQNKGRPMEVSLTASFCLSEYSSSLEQTFEVRKEIDLFYDKEDLLEKIRYYLENEELRKQMAQCAYQKAITCYEAEIVFSKLGDELFSALKGARAQNARTMIYTDTVFKKNQIAKLCILMFYQLSRGGVAVAFESLTGMFRYGFVIFLGSFCRGVRISAQKLLAKSRRRRRGLDVTSAF